MTQSGGGGGGNLGAAVLRITVDDSAARTALSNLQAQIRAANDGLNAAQNRNRNNRNADNGADEADRSLLAQQAILKRVQAVRKQIDDLEARGYDGARGNRGASTNAELRTQANNIYAQSAEGVTRALKEQLNTLEMLTKEEKNYYSTAKTASDYQETPGVPLGRRAQRSTRNSVRDSLFDLDKLERTGFDNGRITELRNQGLALQLSLERGITAESQRRAEILKDGVTAAKQEQALNRSDTSRAQAAAARAEADAQRSRAVPAAAKRGLAGGINDQELATDKIAALKRRINALDRDGVNVGEARARVMQIEARAAENVDAALFRQLKNVSRGVALDEERYRTAKKTQQEIDAANAKAIKNAVSIPVNAQDQAVKALLAIRGKTNDLEAKGVDVGEIRTRFAVAERQVQEEINGAVLKEIDLLGLLVKERERDLTLLRATERQTNRNLRTDPNGTTDVAPQERSAKSAIYQLDNAILGARTKGLDVASAEVQLAAARQAYDERNLITARQIAEQAKQTLGTETRQAELRKTEDKAEQKRLKEARLFPNASLRGAVQSGGEALGLALLLGRGPAGTALGIAGGVGGDVLGGRRGGRVGYTLGFAGGQILDDAVTRVTQLGDALRDPVANFTQLREAAILSSRGFESLTQAMIESGRTGQAAALIQLDLVRRYGTLDGLDRASAAGDSVKRGVAGLQDLLNPLAQGVGSTLSAIVGRRPNSIDYTDLRTTMDTAEGPKYRSAQEAIDAQNRKQPLDKAALLERYYASKELSDQTIGSKLNAARLSGSGLDSAAVAASIATARAVYAEKLQNERDKLANDKRQKPENSGLFDMAFQTTQANLQVERDTAIASAQNQVNQKFRGVRDRGELLNATRGLTGSGLEEAQAATERKQAEREILRLRAEAAKYPALEAASRLDILAIEQNITELANKRMLAERSLAADRVASEGRIASLRDRSVLAARSVELTGTGSSILSAIADYRNAQREVVNAQARAFANPGDQSAALALKEAMESVRTSAVETSAKLIQGFRTARTEALAASTSLAQGVARLGNSRTDPNGIRKYIAPFSLYNLDRNTNDILYPQFDKARNYINNLTGGGFKFNYNGTQKDINTRMADVINVVAQDRMNSNLEDLRRANDQATQALAVARDGLKGNSEAMKDLNGSVAALVAKDWSVNVAVNGASAVVYADAVNRGL